ncbi:hypothetical protein ACVWZK_003065 [Bradyrhizobium sp. GM0.4]
MKLVSQGAGRDRHVCPRCIDDPLHDPCGPQMGRQSAEAAGRPQNVTDPERVWKVAPHIGEGLAAGPGWSRHREECLSLPTVLTARTTSSGGKGFRKNTLPVTGRGATGEKPLA